MQEVYEGSKDLSYYIALFVMMMILMLISFSLDSCTIVVMILLLYILFTVKNSGVAYLLRNRQGVGDGSLWIHSRIQVIVPGKFCTNQNPTNR